MTGPFADLTPAQRMQIREAQGARKAAEMRAVLAKHMPRNHRRHPAQVTSDRLAEARERWMEYFTGEELDMIGVLRDRLEQIASGEAE